MKKSIALFLVCMIMFNLGSSQVYAISSDTNVSTWAVAEVQEADDYGLLVSGLGNDYTRKITREEFCRLVVNMVEEANGNELPVDDDPFTDTSEVAILKAYGTGIVKGTSETTFSPDANISRQEIAVMLIRAVKVNEELLGRYFLSDISVDEDLFADEDQIAYWAMTEVKLANKYGIMNGVGQNKINPRGNTTVEQAILLVKRLFEKQILNGNTAELDDSVVFIDEEESELFYSQVEEITVSDDGNQVVVFDEIPTEIEGKDVGDIVFIEPSRENPYGYIGKIEEEQLSGSSTTVTFSTPYIDEVFDDLEVHIDNRMTAGNVIGYEVPEGVSVYASAEEKTLPLPVIASRSNRAIASVGNFLKDKTKNKDRDAEVYGVMNGLTEIQLGMKDAVLYDRDGKRTTLEDQIRFDGGLTLNNIGISGDIDINGSKFKELSLIASIEELELDVNCELGMDYEFNAESIFGENVTTTNGHDLGIIAIEGVDMSNSIVVGSITFDLTTLTAIPSTGEVAKMPLAAVVMFTVDINGNVKATVSASMNYKAKIVKGISITDKKLKKDIKPGETSYVSGKYNINEYNQYKTEDSIKIEVSGSAHGELNVTLGPEVGLMLGGIMPVTVKTHGGVKLSADGDAIKICCDNGKWDVSGPGFSANIELGKYATIATKLTIELRGIPFVKSKHGFDYKWEDSDILWEKAFSTSETDYTLTITDEGVITGYTGTLPNDLIIPDKINGISVTSIGAWAFDDCTSLTSITIPDSVTSIGNYAFNDCISLTSITIPDSVTSIGVYVFDSCSNMKKFVVNKNNEEYQSRDGVLFGDNEKTLLNVPDGKKGKYTIPNSVTSIGFEAFKDCTSLTSITIPEAVTSIGWQAFKDCTSLTSITIPNSVTSISDRTFEGCSNLTEIIVNKSNEEYQSKDGVLFSDNEKTLLNVPEGKKGKYIIPNSVTSIGDYAFKGCTNLTSVTIPEGVGSIGEFAFNDCTTLTSIAIPNSVTSIGVFAFTDCTSLTRITIPEGVTCNGAYPFEGAFMDVYNSDEGGAGTYVYNGSYWVKE